MKEINPNIITKFPQAVLSRAAIAASQDQSSAYLPQSKSQCRRRVTFVLYAAHPQSGCWGIRNLSLSLSLLSKKRGGGYRDKQHSSRSLSISLALVFFISWLVRSCSPSFSIMDQILVISYDVASCVCLFLSRSWWFLKLSRAQRCLIKPFTLHKYTAGISFNTVR